MAYENIRLTKPNMTVADGYFYFFDESRDVLFVKLDDGSTAFTYPLDTLLTSTINSLEYYDGNFWTMNDITNGVSIKRWELDNGLCKLREFFDFAPNFSSDAFAVSYYDTTLVSTVSGGDNIINTAKYYDTVITSGTILSLGPNISMEYEDVEVLSVSGTDITLVSGTQYSYDIGDIVSFYDYFWIFNSDGAGSLVKANAHTGGVVNTYNDPEYNAITACTFARVSGPESSAVDTLVYVKGVNAVYVNVDDLSNYATMVMDNLRSNGITVIPVYDISIQENNLYRLQDEGTYYGVDNDWGSQYNYVVSPIRRFVNTISVAAYPVILPANGYNTLEVTALVTDQYGDGAVNKPVFFTDTDSVGYITINPAYTEPFFGTGEAITYYRAGVTVQTVTIEGTATQFD